MQGLRHHRFAHFACHGVFEAGKPFDTSLKLRGDNRLTMLGVVRSRLPVTEFALLSACHAAELTDGSIVDEALHLTTAVQFCGFRSVICTMWAMADTDWQDLAEYFYKSMFFGGHESIPCHEKALRDAMQKLRRETSQSSALGEFCTLLWGVVHDAFLVFPVSNLNLPTCRTHELSDYVSRI